MKRRNQRRSGYIIWVGIAGLLLGIGLFVVREWPEIVAIDSLDQLNQLDPTASAISVPTISNTPTALPPTYIRTILFPGVASAGVIVDVPQVPGGWDVQNLQDLVGHLAGTAWFGNSGNTVLVGHFEDEIGRPGPFRYLYEAKVGDRILIQDNQSSVLSVYEVQQVFSTAPNDLEVLRHTDAPRLTLITCDAWSYASKRYEERLVVVAVPIGVYAPTTTASLDNGVN
ncbi:MAG: class F sortase [Chloroflexi bacterium]|nr:class F sortase [Chloroflexota bacterium]